MFNMKIQYFNTNASTYAYIYNEHSTPSLISTDCTDPHFGGLFLSPFAESNNAQFIPPCTSTW